MSESPRTPVPEPDSGDTASWLVEELVTRDAKPPEPAASDEDWGGVATQAEEHVDPDDEEAPEGDDVIEDDEELAGAVAELRRELAQTTVELDRIAGRVREEVLAELETLEAFSERLDSLDEQVRSLAADVAETQEALEVLARYGVTSRPTEARSRHST